MKPLVGQQKCCSLGALLLKTTSSEERNRQMISNNSFFVETQVQLLVFIKVKNRLKSAKSGLILSKYSK